MVVEPYLYAAGAGVAAAAACFFTHHYRWMHGFLAGAGFNVAVVCICVLPPVSQIIDFMTGPAGFGLVSLASAAVAMFWLVHR